jgi:hypothetical protein
VDTPISATVSAAGYWQRGPSPALPHTHDSSYVCWFMCAKVLPDAVEASWQLLILITTANFPDVMMPACAQAHPTAWASQQMSQIGRPGNRGWPNSWLWGPRRVWGNMRKPSEDGAPMARLCSSILLLCIGLACAQIYRSACVCHLLLHVCSARRLLFVQLPSRHCVGSVPRTSPRRMFASRTPTLRPFQRPTAAPRTACARRHRVAASLSVRSRPLGSHKAQDKQLLSSRLAARRRSLNAAFECLDWEGKQALSNLRIEAVRTPGGPCDCFCATACARKHTTGSWEASRPEASK